MTHRFSQVANRVIPSLTSGPQVSVSSAVSPPEIIYDGMLSRTVTQGARHVSQTSTRAVSGIPTNAGKTPPKLEDFDPLNPGEWQLGAAGKILPRLPEGTRCGKLVMGKYGLYSPVVRKRVEAYSAGLDAGKKSEAATPFDRNMTNVAKVLAFICLAIGFHNTVMLIYGKPIWPLHNIKAPGAS
ncbi:hypothetical protein FO519_002964 [Halicephalobus sp. NKZ332]|nr:hypothetical protein FO519_002964 [Halicephalobus sp. NKZ332]